MKCENIAKHFWYLQKAKIYSIVRKSVESGITIEENADHSQLKREKTLLKNLKDITSDNISVSEQQNCS